MRAMGTAVAAFIGCVTLAVAYWTGHNAGAAQAKAAQAKEDALVRKVQDAALQGAADAISKIKITNTTIRQQAETVVCTERVYADCRHTGGMLDNINAALTGKPLGVGQLPRADAAQ